MIDFAFDKQYDDFALNKSNLKMLLKLIKNRPFTVNGEKVLEIKPFALPLSLDKENNLYRIKTLFNLEDLTVLTDDYEYIYYKNYIYILNEKQSYFLGALHYNHMEELVFENKKDFASSIIPIIKENITLTDRVNDIVIIKKPKVKLYFDINYNSINLNPKFYYKGNVY